MLPPITNQKWKELALGQNQYQFQMLAAKILMNRIKQSTKADPSPQNVSKCIQELFDFFLKNEKLAQKDISQLFG
ncbi:MAG: hypothetical protein HY961_00720 [Ignavibacteriae bacterium]|nr:hypothetical protein [Ignavibacteriota bacterium]